MKGGSNKPMSKALQNELAALEAMPDTSIDTSEIPEVKNWKGAKRGVYYRVNKRLTSLRLDADVLDWFKTTNGRGYQTRINAELRGVMEAALKR